MKRWLFFVAGILGCRSATAQAVVGIPYSEVLGSAGDTFINVYSFDAGTLPPRLRFTQAFLGQIAGIPTTAGSYTFSVSHCNAIRPGTCQPVVDQKTIMVRQPCAAILKQSDNFGYGGGTGQVSVAADPTCAWGGSMLSAAAAAPPFWVHLSVPSSTGDATVTYTVDSSTYDRTVTFLIGDNLFTITQAAQAAQGLQFYPVTPCRAADTRDVGGALEAGETREFNIVASGCGIPASAKAFSMNVTVAPHAALGYLTVWPAGTTRNRVSVLNSPSGRTVANAAIVPAGTNGAVSVYATDATDVVLDINGYFAPPSANGLAFYPVAPCRVADTREAAKGPSLMAGVPRNVAVSGVCGAPASARAYSMNATVVPKEPLGYLTLWPGGEVQPLVSTLNSPAGSILANGALVPAGADGSINAFATDSTDLVLDINGYFAPPAAGGLLYYPVPPCRVADTRPGEGFPGESPAIAAGTSRGTSIVTNTCGVPITARAVSLNATAVPGGPLGYLTLWPFGQAKPFVSTLNGPDGAIVANAAIVPLDMNGSVNAFATDTTDLVLDVNGYFAP